MEGGIRCAEVSLQFPEGAHMIVASETVGRELIYVEPQQDIIIPEFRVGDEYWEVVNKYSSSSQKFELHFDDTIVRIIMLW